MTPMIEAGSRAAPAAARMLAGVLLAWLVAAPATARPPAPSASAPAGTLAATGLAPRAGRFLVAAEGMRDPRFSKTVILIIAHDESGTLGLVLNKPTDVSLSEALPGLAWSEDRPRVLFLGGPVLLQGVSFLLRSGKIPPRARRVLEDVYHSTSLALLAQLALEKDRTAAFRVFAGHAGWAPGQLEGELMRRDWHVMTARAEEIFHEPPSEIWPALIQRAGAEWVRLPGRPPAAAALDVPRRPPRHTSRALADEQHRAARFLE